MLKKEVDILLSTYNGESFLNEQLNSLVNQTFKSWNLIIRDDGSTDSTLEIIQRFKEEFPEKTRIVNQSGKNLGSSLSFLELVKYSESKYLMFCDQDDIWLPEKIHKTLQEMEIAEKINGEVPVLVASDLIIVDEEDRKVLGNSFWGMRKDSMEVFQSHQNLIAQSVITGSTMMFNRMAKQILPQNDRYIPFYKHDQWICFHVAETGKIRFIKESLTKYRQHTNNVVGYYQFKLGYLIKKYSTIHQLIANLIKLKKGKTIKFSIPYVLYFKLKYNIQKLLR